MRVKIALGAAQGLAYLHQDCKPQVVHRDVKSCNILLNANMEAHLCDFGLAKNIQPTRTHTSTFVLGTIGYIDPEYAQTSRLNDKSDVYSFGIVLLELLMGKKAVEDEINLLDWVCALQLTTKSSASYCPQLGLLDLSFNTFEGLEISVTTYVTNST